MSWAVLVAQSGHIPALLALHQVVRVCCVPLAHIRINLVPRLAYYVMLANSRPLKVILRRQTAQNALPAHMQYFPAQQYASYVLKARSNQ